MAFTIAKQGMFELRLVDRLLRPGSYIEVVHWFPDYKTCYTVARLEWDSDEGPDLQYIGDRPFTNPSGFTAFNKFVKKILLPLFEYDTLSNYLTKAHPEALI